MNESRSSDTTAPNEILVQTNSAAAANRLHAALQRALDLVAFGLEAIRTASVPDLRLQDAVIQLRADPARALNPEAARGEFARWILGCGLRDAVEAVGTVLEEVRMLCVIWRLGDGAKLKPGEWNERVVQPGGKFERLGLPGKIDYLRDEFDPMLLPALTPHVLSINAARNCLVHRAGIVGPRDVDAANVLSVRFLRTTFVVRGTAGERLIEALPFEMEGGETLSLRRRDEEKSFGLGDRVEFTSREFADLCWTLFQFGVQAVNALNAYGAKLGIPTAADRSASAGA